MRPLPAARPEALLFGARAIALCTFFFTPLVGGVMAALNWRRVGETSRAWTNLAVSVAGTAAVGLLAALAPASWDSAVRGACIGITIGLATTFSREHKPLIDQHLAAGGKTASPLWPVLGGIVVLGTILGLSVLPFLEADREFEAGSQAFDAGRYAEAEGHFRAALENDAANDAARFNLGLSLARQGKVEEGMRELGHIERSSELWPQAREILGGSTTR